MNKTLKKVGLFSNILTLYLLITQEHLSYLSRVIGIWILIEVCADLRNVEK
jgi:hypothetical protein